MLLDFLKKKAVNKLVEKSSEIVSDIIPSNVSHIFPTGFGVIAGVKRQQELEKEKSEKDILTALIINKLTKF